MNETFLDRDNRRQNNFGALRLLFALAVLISHAFAAYAGKHEGADPLCIFTGGQMDLGSLAVQAFFAISGYLITLSWLRTPKLKAFLLKRVLRIYPGFIVASIISLLVFAPLSGAKWSIAFAPVEVVKSVLRIVLLSGPKAIGSFASEQYPVLNMSLWTIRYEFICYLLVPLIVVVLARLKCARVGILVGYLTVLVWYASEAVYFASTDAFELPIVGSFDVWPRFLTYFLGGMVFAINADRIPFRHWVAGLCVVLMLVTAQYGGFFLTAATAGTYLLFYAAYQHGIPAFRIGERSDLSYGVYLYAWPIQLLLIQNLRHVSGPTSIMLLALPLTLSVAALSWYLVEARFLARKVKLQRRDEPVTPARPSGTVRLVYRSSATPISPDQFVSS